MPHTKRPCTLSAEFASRLIILAFRYYQKNSQECFPNHKPSLNAMFDAGIEEVYKRFPGQISSLREFRKRFVRRTDLAVYKYWLTYVVPEIRDESQINNDMAFKNYFGYTFSPEETTLWCNRIEEDIAEVTDIYQKK